MLEKLKKRQQATNHCPSGEIAGISDSTVYV